MNIRTDINALDDGVSIKRRHFFMALAAGPLVRRVPRAQARITRIRLVSIQGRFQKLVAMNAYDKEPKGRTYTQPLIRIETNHGIEGVGAGIYAVPHARYIQALRSLIGVNPMTLYEFRNGRITGRSPSLASLLLRYKHLDGPLYDLIGKLTAKPVWQLIGDSARDRVRAYDTTLYFSDILYPKRGVGGVVSEAEESVRAGYTAVKLKLGRGFKWMEQTAGVRRDVSVVEAVRTAVGKHLTIMGDANNGYMRDPDDGWRMLTETRNARLYWIEQIFPASVEHYTWLKSKLSRAGMKTLIADGESWDSVEAFAPYLKPRRLVDVLQMDIRRGGFVANLELARIAKGAGAVMAPHNWASQIGLFMGLQFAKAVPNDVIAEDDRSTCDGIVAHGYRFEKGFYTVPSEPGLGISMDPQIYNSRYKRTEQTVS